MSVADWVDDIAQYLDDQGVGVYNPGAGETVNIFIHHMMDSPVTCLCVYEYAGRPPRYHLDAGRYDRPGLQIVARAAGADPLTAYHTAQALLRAADAALDNLANVTIGSHTYNEIRALGGVAPLGFENGVLKASQNYMTERR